MVGEAAALLLSSTPPPIRGPHPHPHTPPSNRYDANISLPGCDKNMPGTLMAMARLNRPSLMIYGGTIKPGYSKLTGATLDIVSAFQSYGALFGGGGGSRVSGF